MNKYFQNKNKITVQQILKTYQDYYWGDFPQYTYNKRQAQRLIDQCQQSDQYKNWSQQIKTLEEQIKQSSSQIQQIKHNKNEIILRNSEAEYNQILQRLEKECWGLKSELSNRKSKAPKSKYQLLKPIFESMEKEESKAREQLNQRIQNNISKCRCSGHYCEC